MGGCRPQQIWDSRHCDIPGQEEEDRVAASGSHANECSGNVLDIDSVLVVAVGVDGTTQEGLACEGCRGARLRNALRLLCLPASLLEVSALVG